MLGARYTVAKKAPTRSILRRKIPSLVHTCIYFVLLTHTRVRVYSPESVASGILMPFSFEFRSYTLTLSCFERKKKYRKKESGTGVYARWVRQTRSAPEKKRNLLKKKREKKELEVVRFRSPTIFSWHIRASISCPDSYNYSYMHIQ